MSLGTDQVMAPPHVRGGHRHIRRGLCESGWAAAHTQNTFLGATFWRLTGRTGKRKVLLAIAHKQAIAADRIQKEKLPYQELGADCRRRADTQRFERSAIKKLEALGYRVSRPEEGETGSSAGCSPAQRTNTASARHAVAGAPL
jgi:transposase